jgi:hypothetical protein
LFDGHLIQIHLNLVINSSIGTSKSSNGNVARRFSFE